MRILIPGGHLTPALGLIDWIKQHHPQDRFVFIGREFSQESLKQKAIEEYELKKRKVIFIPFKAVKFERSSLLFWLIKPFVFLHSLSKAHFIIKDRRPDVVMSFGGYMAVPFAIAAWAEQVPIVAHEGTRVIGLANKIIFKFASKIALAFPSLENMDYKKIKKEPVVTGIPLRSSLLTNNSAPKPLWLKSAPDDKKILLVLGGNQGSKALNDIVRENLHWLTEFFVVVHQCGRPNKLYNYKQELTTYAQERQIKQDAYYVRTWIDEQDLVWLYQNASLALSRAGANSIQELVYHQLPSILVPLPYAHYDEQLVNARFLSNQQAAYLLPQAELSAASLTKAVKSVSKNHHAYQLKLRDIKKEMILNSAEKLYQLLLEAVEVDKTDQK